MTNGERLAQLEASHAQMAEFSITTAAILKTLVLDQLQLRQILGQLIVVVGRMASEAPGQVDTQASETIKAQMNRLEFSLDQSDARLQDLVKRLNPPAKNPA